MPDPNTKECCQFCFKGGDYETRKCKDCPCHIPKSEEQIEIYSTEIVRTVHHSRSDVRGATDLVRIILKNFASQKEAEGYARGLEEIREKLLEARSDAAPFNIDPLKHAENLVRQKNEIIDSLLTPKTDPNQEK